MTSDLEGGEIMYVATCLSAWSESKHPKMNDDCLFSPIDAVI
jgi:hypothetical protein